MEIQCPKCGDKDVLPENMKGRQLKCGQCGTLFVAGSPVQKSSAQTGKILALIGILALCLVGALVGSKVLQGKKWTPDEVARIADPAQLAMFARQGESASIRLAAVENPALTDQALLANLAMKETDSALRAAAVLKLTDQAVVSAFALEETDIAVREAAVKNPVLMDQAVMAKLAMDKEVDPKVRAAAVIKLTDQELITKLVLEEGDPTVHAAALVVQLSK